MRRQCTRKLLVGEKVEVRSASEGLKGSWLPGFITASDNMIRRVRYDDNYGTHPSGIHVSSAIEGEDTVVTPKHYRGLIRPVPPLLLVEKVALDYRLCVDIYINNLWREGVISDQEKDSKDRLVFFPDSGDEQVFPVEKMRITQDWDETSECWTPRGNWVFLDLIGELVEDFSNIDSEMEIWTKVRAKEEFKKLNIDWTCRDRSLWRDLVLEVIRDLGVNTYMIKSPGKQRKPECGRCDFDIPSNSDSFAREPIGNVGLSDNSIVVDEEYSVSDLLDFSCDPNDSNLDRPLYAGGDFVKDRAIPCSPCDEAIYDCIGFDDNNEVGDTISFSKEVEDLFENSDSYGFTAKEGRDTINCQETGKDMRKETDTVHFWLPVGPDILPGSENFPDAIINYFLTRSRQNKKRNDDRSSMLLKVRMHLSYLQWKIEYTTKAETRVFRYIAPAGRTFYSLYEVCKYLSGGAALKIKTPRSENGDRKLLDNGITVPQLSTSKKRKLLDNNVGSLKIIKRSTDPISDELGIEAEYCIQAVIDWFKIGTTRKNNGEESSKSLTLKAKKHLLAVGWKIWYITKKEGKRELRYSSMTKTYISLVTACKAYLEEEGIFKSNSPMNGLVSAEQAEEEKNSDNPNISLEKTLKPNAFQPCQKPSSGCLYAPINGLVSVERRTGIEKSENLHLSSETDPNATQPCQEPEAISLHAPSDELPRKTQKRLHQVEESTFLLNEQSETCSTESLGSLQSKMLLDQNPTHQELKKQREAYGFLKRKNVPLIGRRESQPQTDGRHESQPQTETPVPISSKRTRKAEEGSPLSSLHTEKLLAQNPHVQEPMKQNTHGILKRIKDPSNVQVSTKRARKVEEASPFHQMPRTVISCLIDNNVVLPRSNVYYIGRKNHKMAEGRITREGIKCTCCQKLFGLSSFEAHAGSTIRRPAANIFLEDGRSLMQCQREMVQDKNTNKKGCSQKSRERIKRNQACFDSDYICSICHYGGTLLLCDHCPSAFHLSCLGIEELPPDQWFCQSCHCGICDESEFNDDIKKFTEKSVLYCDQCEREYHVGCIRKREQVKLESPPNGNWFCSPKCQEIFVGLYELMGKSIPVGKNNLSWTILKSSKSDYHDLDAYRGDTMIDHYSKLSVALSVIHECFEPIKEPRTKSDLVEDVLFNRWSELDRLNCWGFYTVILEREDELISVATVRVYGEKVAEVPLVGTRLQYRRQGMCSILMSVLEKKLAELGVERLFLPAIPQVVKTWTTSFGFSKMTSCERLKFLKYIFLDFQDTTMCQKILKSTTSEVTRIDSGEFGYGDGHRSSGASEVIQVEQLNHSEAVEETGDHSSDLTQAEQLDLS
ncbi:hypothetical protein GIB67_014356 [Kingdonia uniflora]|uniref:Uncharacterized protein n=1 Tax=Kingdonia uniflora TaxID=39325 RepID=A0A7J7NTB6_9MAGN|nr:hypothetical protein GIB67_014356 [Kingdonia uniflora]